MTKPRTRHSNRLMELQIEGWGGICSGNVVIKYSQFFYCHNCNIAFFLHFRFPPTISFWSTWGWWTSFCASSTLPSHCPPSPGLLILGWTMSDGRARWRAPSWPFSCQWRCGPSVASTVIDSTRSLLPYTTAPSSIPGGCWLDWDSVGLSSSF